MRIASKLASVLDRHRPPPDGAEAQALDATPIVDWRIGIRLPGRRYYLNIRIGRERRTLERLAGEGQVRMPVGAVAYGVAATAFFFAFGVLCFLYLLKSVAGIDLFAEHSPLHPLFELVR